MKSLIIISCLFNVCLSFGHYKHNNLKSTTPCPYSKKQQYKTNINKKNVLITYPYNYINNTNYNPRNVDWESVISGCHAACNFDKRLCNFYIRASAHDSLSISEGFGGTDGSMLITEEELNRPENDYDNFGYIISKNALALAKKFDASVADIISVCGAYSVKYLGGIDIIKTSSGTNPFLVGRLDSNIPNPANQLVPDDANTDLFNNFAIKYGFSLEEFTALLGSHALLDNKECLNKDNSSCNPLIEECTNLSMFTWDNSYYYDLCNSNITMQFNVKSLERTQTKKQMIKNELCKFTGSYFQQKTKDDLKKELNLDINNIINENNLEEENNLFTEIEPEFNKPIDISIYENNTIKRWNFTINDAWLGLACQNKLENNYINNNIKNSMISFKNINYWNTIYSNAYKKMINNNARWFRLRSNGFRINGNECKSGYKIINNNRICKTAFLSNDKYYY
jgi:hypothetical protein